LDIPELLGVVCDWDQEVRSILPETGFWFAPLSTDTGEIDPTCVTIGDHREALARRNLKGWLEKVGLPYRSPHKFRHGHIRYGRDHCKSIADFKAVSENVMHSNMGITDTIYSQMSDNDVRERIDALGRESNSGGDEDEFELFREFLAWRKSHK
jgi:integrase